MTYEENNENALHDSASDLRNGVGTCEARDTPLTQPRSGFDLPKIRELLKPMARLNPTVGTLRKQLSGYERGDAQRKAALRPMILESVKQLHDHQ